MIIKPIEKSKTGIYLRLLIIPLLVIIGFAATEIFKNKKTIIKSQVGKTNLVNSGTKILSSGINQTENFLGQVLGETTRFVTDSASQSAQQVSDFVFDNTIGSIIGQINKLPKREQERVRERICK